MNITANASHAVGVAPKAMSGRIWAHPAIRSGLAMTAKPTNPRPLSPPELLSP